MGRVDNLSDLGQALDCLPPRQREVLILVSYEGLSPREIASMLDITEANVHATIHAARRRLRRQLAPYMAER